MLVQTVVNDWGEVTYVPTTLGKILLAVLILALLVVSVVLVKKTTQKEESAKKKGLALSAKQLAFCAMALDLGDYIFLGKGEDKMQE